MSQAAIARTFASKPVSMMGATSSCFWAARVATLVVIAVITICNLFSAAKRADAAEPADLKVAIAPYQDLAMLVNAPKKGFDVRAGINIDLMSMAWEDILPAVASAGTTVDVGFGSYVEYLTKFERLNAGTSDPVVFVQPLYVYKGGGFITLSPEIAPFRPAELTDPAAMQRLKRYKIGAQKQSLYDMMLYSVATQSRARPPSSRMNLRYSILR